MNDVVVDSSVVAKWILSEPDSAHASRLTTEIPAAGGKLVVLDLIFPEVANVIWKKHRQNIIALDEARRCLGMLARLPIHVEPAVRVLDEGFEIAVKYDRAVYDALFVALSHHLGLMGVTADEPLYNMTHADFPQVVLLRDWP